MVESGWFETVKKWCQGQKTDGHWLQGWELSKIDYIHSIHQTTQRLWCINVQLHFWSQTRNAKWPALVREHSWIPIVVDAMEGTLHYGVRIVGSLCYKVPKKVYALSYGCICVYTAGWKWIVKEGMYWRTKAMWNATQCVRVWFLHLWMERRMVDVLAPWSEWVCVMITFQDTAADLSITWEMCWCLFLL